MRTLSHLFRNNRQWAREITERDPAFFSKLVNQQSPDHLWIGCADSRVPANGLLKDLQVGVNGPAELTRLQGS